MLACWASRGPAHRFGRLSCALGVAGGAERGVVMYLVRLNRVRGRVVALLAVGAIVVLTWVAGASATPSSAVSFYLTQKDNYDPIAWQAQGAIVDAGTWDRGVITFSGGKSPGFAGMIQTFETNTAGTGSFRMNFQGRGINDPFSFGGTWQITDGTGIYKG